MRKLRCRKLGKRLPKLRSLLAELALLVWVHELSPVKLRLLQPDLPGHHLLAARPSSTSKEPAQPGEREKRPGSLLKLTAQHQLRRPKHQRRQQHLLQRSLQRELATSHPPRELPLEALHHPQTDGDLVRDLVAVLLQTVTRALLLLRLLVADGEEH